MLNDLVGNVQSGAEGLREKDSCWRGCQGVSTMSPYPKGYQGYLKLFVGVKCALEGEPGLEQRQDLGLQSALSCSSIHVLFCLSSFLTGNLFWHGLGVCAYLSLIWGRYSCPESVVGSVACSALLCSLSPCPPRTIPGQWGLTGQ